MTHKIILSADSACDLGPELKERCLAASELGHVYPVDSCNLSSHCGPNTLGILFETL